MVTKPNTQSQFKKGFKYYATMIGLGFVFACSATMLVLGGIIAVHLSTIQKAVAVCP